MKKSIKFILFGVACYLVNFFIFDGDAGSIIGGTLNSLGIVSIIGGIVLFFREKKK